MFTVDRATIDSTGAFVVGELERMDQTLNMPLVSVKYTRDIPLRSDISIADEVSSFTNTDFSSVGGPNPMGKNWMGKKGTATPGPELNIEPTRNNLTPWATEVSWTVLELASAQKLGRPIDVQKYEAMKLKWNMDTDEQVYIGDSGLGVAGMLNLPDITPLAAAAAWTSSCRILTCC